MDPDTGMSTGFEGKSEGQNKQGNPGLLQSPEREKIGVTTVPGGPLLGEAIPAKRGAKAGLLGVATEAPT